MKPEEMKVYYGTMQIEEETAYLAATENGLCWAGGFNESFHNMEAWLIRQLPNLLLVEEQEKVKPYVQQFEEYFRGERKAFNFTLDLQGTAFQNTVWEALQHIPYGETVTYSEIADQIKNPKAIRAVGGAIGKNPVLIAVPCHRVINKNGALGGFRGGLPLKRKLLQIEKQRVQAI